MSVTEGVSNRSLRLSSFAPQQAAVSERRAYLKWCDTESLKDLTILRILLGMFSVGFQS